MAGLGMDSLPDTVPPDQGRLCPALRRLVPVGFGAEAWTLFVLSGPLVRRRGWGTGCRPGTTQGAGALTGFPRDPPPHLDQVRVVPGADP